MLVASIMVGATSRLRDIFIQDQTSLNGGGLTGLVYNSAGLTCYYHKSDGSASVSVSLTSMTLGTYTANGFIEVDATHKPGWYQFGIPDAAISSGTNVSFTFMGATNMVLCPLEIDLTVTNDQALNDVNVSKFGGTTVTGRDIGASVLLSSGTGTGQVSLAAGLVTAGTVSDKTGYSLTQAFPANFSSLSISGGGAVTISQSFPTNFSALAITGGGAVTAGTVSDKTGYSLSQTFPSNFSSLSIDGSGRVDVGKILGTASAGAAGYVGVDWSNIHSPTATVDLSGTTISTGQVVASVTAGVTIAGGFKKNTAFTDVPFEMLDETTGEPTAGFTVTVARIVQGDASATVGGITNILDLGDGVYSFDGDAADNNGDFVTFLCTATGAKVTIFTVITTP